MAAQVEGHSVKAAFHYSMFGVPKGGQLERRFFVRGKTNTVIPIARSAEAHIAYRMKLPADNLIDMARPTNSRWTEYPEYDRTAATIEIIQHAGKLWWPVKLDDKKSRYDIGSLTNVLEHLAAGKGNFLNMLPLEVQERTVLENRPLMRTCPVDESDACESLARRAVSENMLIWRDRIFALGGEPIYVKLTFGRKRYWHTEVVNSDPNRQIYRTVIGPQTDFDSYTSWWAQDSMCWGHFLYAQQHELVQQAVHPKQPRVPTIEICGNSLALDRTRHLMVDALLRKTLAILGKYGVSAPSGLLRNLDGRETDELTTSLRHASLAEFFRKQPDLTMLPGTDELRQQFEHFERSISASARLAVEDEAALVSIGAG